MKRTDLIALIDRLSPQSISHIYEGLCPDSIEGWDSRDPECEACRQLEAAREAADFLRQIAQAQPVGYLLKTGHGNRFAETIPANPLELTWAGKPAWSAIYTLPLED